MTIVIKPTGISNGGKRKRPKKSEKTVIVAPIKAEPNKLNLCEFPKINLDIFGAISPIKPKLPEPETETPAKNKATKIAIIFHFVGLNPTLEETSSLKSKKSNFL